MTEETPADKPEPRVPWPIRVSRKGIRAFTKAAAKQGYVHPTTWARDVLAAEAVNPLHKPTPKKK